ncbi:helix-turn-helix transcriptional regulator [Kutzneria sp. 744]|uniref:helix-turn-helix transcriptional regulator n=1 Tax=Kutzneria sp. (strain 744) TaxID=345341 RepID=UPI0012FA1366|nr:helix-turn-helix transcriptional regulator [Kutzneria sp. 744]
MGRVLAAYRADPRHKAVFGEDGITQTLLGRWLGISQAEVSRYENAKIQDSLSTMIRWAATLGMPQRYLWFDLPRQQRPNSIRDSAGDPASPGDAEAPKATARLDSVTDANPAVSASQQQWRQVRGSLAHYGTRLTTMALELYPDEARVSGLPVLAAAGWVPEQPVPLDAVALEWVEHPPPPLITGQEPEAAPTLPLRAPGRAFPSYSSAIRYLAPPSLFENRASYRLLGSSLQTPNGPVLTFGLSSYFAKFDVAEALVHELAAYVHRDSAPPTLGALPYRALLGTRPFELADRAVNLSVTAVTLRAAERAGTPEFLVLQRDSRAVAVGSGMTGLIPAGEFQPASIAPQSIPADLDIWKTLVREYSEELLGMPEHDGSSGVPVDYDCWPFYRDITQARDAGQVRVHVLGLVMDPLSLNLILSVAVVFDAPVFDVLFRQMASSNVEGTLVSDGGARSKHGIAFSAENVGRFWAEGRMGASCTAALQLAWRHRARLLSD